jgi:hypothetical protein
MERRAGMREFETFRCGVCGKPVETEWRSGGLLPGPYALLGDVFFHTAGCADEYIVEFERACRESDARSERTSHDGAD